MPMLATAGPVPHGPGWAFEFKWDGVRAVVAAAGDQVQLMSRLGNDVTAGYPELAGIGAVTGGRPVLLDGEIVVLDAAGRPDFGLLQDRMHVRHPSAELRARLPVSFYAFDVLHVDGASLLAAPYDERRARLAELQTGRPGARAAHVRRRRRRPAARRRPPARARGRRREAPRRAVRAREALARVDQDRPGAHAGGARRRLHRGGGAAHGDLRLAAARRVRRGWRTALSRPRGHRVHRRRAGRPDGPPAAPRPRDQPFRRGRAT